VLCNAGILLPVHSRLAGAIFVLLQVLSPIHQGRSAPTSRSHLRVLYDRLTRLA